MRFEISDEVIAQDQYRGNPDITELVLCPGVREIGLNAFRECINLESVVIPGTVQTVGRCAFMVCRQLRTVMMSDGVSRIENEAFFGCSSLHYVDMPSSLIHVGPNVFARCTNLDTVKISEELLQRLGAGIFQDSPCHGQVVERLQKLDHIQEEKREYERVTGYRGFFNSLYNVAIADQQSDYASNYREVCVKMANVDFNVINEQLLKQIYFEENNRIADVGRGNMSVQFANYNANHPDERLSWEVLDKDALTKICRIVKGLNIEDRNVENELAECWDEFYRVVKCNLRFVFNRMIATVRPDLVLPVVQCEGIDELYRWFVINGFVLENAYPADRTQRTPYCQSVLKWFRQNFQLKSFLMKCIDRNEYEIGPFAWYFVEAFRGRDENDLRKTRRKAAIRNLIGRAGYVVPQGWGTEDDA